MPLDLLIDFFLLSHNFFGFGILIEGQAQFLNHLGTVVLFYTHSFTLIRIY